MMIELQYPFDVDYIFQNKRKIKKQLLLKQNLIEKNIAILGGSTTGEVKNILEIFLLNYGIKPNFYESKYNMYYEDAMFFNDELINFKPDIVYIHTTLKNILKFPTINDNEEKINDLLDSQYLKFENMWNSIYKKFNSVIIQNNFEYPSYRLLGNKDASDIHGKINFITKLNQRFYDYANKNRNFFINDINYVSSCYGLDKWLNDFYWHQYKYAMDFSAIPYLAFNLANIIKSIYGYNKKSVILDLDNTLWGGVISEDGPDKIKIGNGNPIGEAYLEFQKYLKELKSIGIVLNINSKNYYEDAIMGLNSQFCLLKPNDFVIIKSNWENKNINVDSIVHDLNLGNEAFVFVDDNPVERNLVRISNIGVSVPEVNKIEEYIKIIDHNGYFEITNFSNEDLNKTELYKSNLKRSENVKMYNNYRDYLLSLNMVAEIESFKSIYMDRICQLINKSNQFNLTTKRYSSSSLEAIKNDNSFITLYGKLFDIYGDNGLVSIVIGKIKEDFTLHIDLWVMSCRVLKRDLEFAMMNELVNVAKKNHLKYIYGYYYPTLKNEMVSDFYSKCGFEEISNTCDSKIYKLDILNFNYMDVPIEVKNNE